MVARSWEGNVVCVARPGCGAGIGQLNVQIRGRHYWLRRVAGGLTGVILEGDTQGIKCLQEEAMRQGPLQTIPDEVQLLNTNFNALNFSFCFKETSV